MVWKHLANSSAIRQTPPIDPAFFGAERSAERLSVKARIETGIKHAPKDALLSRENVKIVPAKHATEKISLRRWRHLPAPHNAYPMPKAVRRRLFIGKDHPSALRQTTVTAAELLGRQKGQLLVQLTLIGLGS